tara:strand:- start:1239 stop:1676 length:438 start_codon:yes stop_codon:yes gene_type:complete
VTIVSIREQIKSAEDSSSELYEVPEWGVTLQIRSMTARSRALFVAEMASEDGTVSGVNDPARIEGMWWNVISQTCHDPKTGEKAFEDGDQEWLFEKNARIVNDLANECMAASGLSEDSVDDAGKDSSASLTSEAEEIQSEDSTSG